MKHSSHHNMTRLILLLTTLLMACTDAASAATHLYVSPSGSDQNDGSRKRPFLTPSRALDQARQASRRDTLFIHLADGTYQLDETLQLRAEDSGTAKSPTVIVADHPGKAIFSSGVKLDMSGRMESLNWWVGRPRFGHRAPQVYQLWRAGQKVPHASLVPLDSIVEFTGSSRERRELWVSTECFDPVLDLIYGSRLGFAEDESIMNTVKAEEIAGMELIACTEHDMARLRVKNFRVDSKNVRLTFHEPESRLLFSRAELPKFGNVIGGYSLVIPGCWYQDPKDASIVFDPDDADRATGHAKGAPFIIASLERLLQIQGTADASVHHIIFRGITFQYAAWTHMAEAGFVGQPGGDYLTSRGFTERQEAAIVITHGHHIDFADCQFLHFGATAIDYAPGCTECQVTGCHFQDLGGSAIATPTEPASRGFRIQRNTCDDIANEVWYSDAIRSK